MIVPAHADDLKHESDAAAKFYEELNLPGKFNAQHFRETWRWVIEAGNGFILKRLNKEDKIAEAVGIMTMSDPFTGDKVAHLVFWYTDNKPDGLARGLLWMQVEVELQQLQVERFFVSVTVRNEPMMRFIHRKDLKPVEIVYYKEY